MMDLVQDILLTQDCFVTNKERYLWTTTTPHCKTLHAGSLRQFRDRLRGGSDVAYIPQFSRFPQRCKTTDGKTVNLLEVLTEVTSHSLKFKAVGIANAKRKGDGEELAYLKSQLPYITAAGIFEPRCNKGLILPNFCLQLDIDKISDPSKKLNEISKTSDLDILFMTVSPSGNGIKGLIFLRELALMEKVWTADLYSTAFHRAVPIVAAYFKSQFGVVIDEAVKAISQPLYLSHFPDLFVHQHIRPWLQ